MELGICTRYGRHEAAFAALRLADVAAAAGLDVSIYTMTPEFVSLGSRWDHRVIRASHVKFTDWVSRQSHVLWTTTPHLEQMEWVRDQGKRTIALVSWHEVTTFDIMVLAEMQHLICPTRACFDLLRHSEFHNLVCMPWDAGLPLHIKHRNHDPRKPKLLLPLWDGNARRTEMTVMHVMQRVMQRHPDATLTIAYNSSSICSAGKRKLCELRHLHPDRVQCIKSPHPRDRPLLFQAHDLTIWPTHYESLGLVGLQSIEMGTPVIAFNFQPINEILAPSNSISVSCAEITNDIGVPKAVPDYDLFDELLHCALRDTEFIRHLQREVLHGVPERRAIFQRQFHRVLV